MSDELRKMILENKLTEVEKLLAGLPPDWTVASSSLFFDLNRAS